MYSLGLTALLFPKEMIPAISQSRNDVSRASLWACSGRQRTNSCSATTVCDRSVLNIVIRHLLLMFPILEFGVYVDRHGDATNRQVGVIEWEGTAERVAFHPPYVVIFDSRFI